MSLPAVGVERLRSGALDNPNASVLSVRVPLVQLARTVHRAVLLANGKAEKESNRAGGQVADRMGPSFRASTVDRFVDRVAGYSQRQADAGSAWPRRAATT